MHARREGHDGLAASRRQPKSLMVRWKPHTASNLALGKPGLAWA